MIRKIGHSHSFEARKLFPICPYGIDLCGNIEVKEMNYNKNSKNKNRIIIKKKDMFCSFFLIIDWNDKKFYIIENIFEYEFKRSRTVRLKQIKENSIYKTKKYKSIIKKIKQIGKNELILNEYIKPLNIKKTKRNLII